LALDMAVRAIPFEIGLLYGAGIVQGLALVTFPAASAIFTSPTGFNLSGAQYGAMFIPQFVMAIAASALGPRLARRFALRGVLFIGVCGDLLSMALLSVSPVLMRSDGAFVLLCIATGALGLGFGSTVMSLNTLVEGLFPGREDSAVLALNALLGLGTALAPILVSLFTGFGIWWALPAAMTVLLVLLLVALTRASLKQTHRAADSGGRLPPRFWIYAAAVLLYGVVETLCGNWATLYLFAERHVAVRDASLALTAFWIMVTLGRVAIAFLERLVPAQRIYVALPILLAVIFQAIAHTETSVAGIAVFAAAGIACSALLPLSISFGGEEFPAKAGTISGRLIACYQIGYGIAAFGVGTLRQTGVALSEVFSMGSIVAVILAGFALLLARRPAKR
jgi:fucose permease